MSSGLFCASFAPVRQEGGSLQLGFMSTLGGQMAERLGHWAINQKVAGSIPGRAK